MADDSRPLIGVKFAPVGRVHIVRLPEQAVDGPPLPGDQVVVVGENGPIIGGVVRTVPAVVSRRVLDPRAIPRVVRRATRDDLGARLAVHRNRSDGYIENDFLGRDDTNDIDETTARARLDWQAGDALALGLTLMRVDSDNGGCLRRRARATWSVSDTRIHGPPPGAVSPKATLDAGSRPSRGRWSAGGRCDRATMASG